MLSTRQVSSASSTGGWPTVASLGARCAPRRPCLRFGNETELTIVQSAAEADVRIRTSGLDWMGPVVLGGLGLMLAALPGTGQPGFALYWLIYGALMVAEGLWMRTFGVDLRPEFAGFAPSAGGGFPGRKFRQLCATDDSARGLSGSFSKVASW